MTGMTGEFEPPAGRKSSRAEEGVPSDPMATRVDLPAQRPEGRRPAQRARDLGATQVIPAQRAGGEDRSLEQRRQEKTSVAQSRYETAVAKLEKDMGTASEYAEAAPADTSALQQEVDTAERMRKHLNEYQRMVSMQEEIGKLTAESEELTRKMNLVRVKTVADAIRAVL